MLAVKNAVHVGCSVIRTNTTQACSCQKVSAGSAAFDCACRCAHLHPVSDSHVQVWRTTCFCMHSSNRGCMCRMHASWLNNTHERHAKHPPHLGAKHKHGGFGRPQHAPQQPESGRSSALQQTRRKHLSYVAEPYLLGLGGFHQVLSLAALEQADNFTVTRLHAK